jgi:2-iminobutanoate/2-iminopropanoate deaminase
MKKAFVSPTAPKPIGPYSQVVQSGKMLYLSGQIPLGADGKLVEGDVSAQARQVLNNLKGVLDAAGASMNDVVKTTIFLADLSDFENVNKVYAEYFQEPYPARSTIQAGKLPRGAALEIDAIAIVE